jgi:hypothetical protein
MDPQAVVAAVVQGVVEALQVEAEAAVLAFYQVSFANYSQ